MYYKVEKAFYLSAIFLLLSVMFVLKPHQDTQVAEFQQEIKTEVKTVWNQIMVGYEPLAGLELVWNGVNVFYNQSANETIALLTPLPAPSAAQQFIDNVAFAFASTLNFRTDYEVGQSVALASTDPVYNIVPAHDEYAYEGFDFLLEELDANLAQIENLYAFEEEYEYDSLIAQAYPDQTGQVAGAIITYAPESEQSGWMTVYDAQTGQEYCQVKDSATVQKYLGACQYDHF